MVDYLGLLTRPVGGQPLVTERGYICEHCGGWEHSYFETPALEKKLAMLERLRPGSRKLNKAAMKAYQYFDNLQKRVREG